MTLPENDLEKLKIRASPALQRLRVEFDGMVAKMQSAKAKHAVDSAGIASPKELGEAAVKGFTARD
ncbi:MAG TPA: hypothetical protein VFG91_11570 [Woeseiaceae bacterium]|nr:hypothetical protein [Woeseiaceae bacterium]